MYALIVANAVGRYPAYPRSDHPDVSIAEGWAGGTIEGDTYALVAKVAQPAHDAATQNVVEQTPANLSGTWTQVWSVVAASAEEIAARADAALAVTEKADLAAQAAQAVADINAFLAIANPTNAQNAAEIRKIDQRQRAIVKALARLVA